MTSAVPPGQRPRPRFHTRQEAVVTAADPESLFGELPRTPQGVGALWSHQADQLRTYSEHHRDTRDVALELPTGSGKTLVGLLVAEWRVLTRSLAEGFNRPRSRSTSREGTRTPPNIRARRPGSSSTATTRRLEGDRR